MTTDDVTAAKQREVKEQMNREEGVSYQCFSCDVFALTYEDPVFAHCKKMNHEILKCVDPTKVFAKERLGPRDTEGTAVTHMKNWLIETGSTSRFDAQDELQKWMLQFQIEDVEMSKILERVWADNDVFEALKKNAYDAGVRGEDLKFETDQISEVGEYLKGRMHIKQLELDGDLIIFNGQIYEYHAEAQIRRGARRCFVSSRNNIINEIVKYVQDTSDIIDSEKIIEYAHLRALSNGVYNLKTGEFYEEFNPDWIILNQIPHQYDQTKNWSACQKIIEKLIPDKRERGIYYDFIACCLYPYNGIKYQLGVVNVPGTGKTQLMEFAKFLVGVKNTAHASIHSIANDTTTQIEVSKKLLNIDGDLSADDITHIDVLKKWINYEDFTARGIYAKPVVFRPSARLMFGANQMYEISRETDAEAIYDRTQLIKGNSAKIRNSSEDIKDIIEKTITDDEMDGAISFFLDRAYYVYQNQKITDSQTTNEVESIWNEFGNMIRQFVQTRLVRVSGAKVVKGDLFEAWDDYVYQKNFHQGAGTKSKFYKKFEDIIGIEAHYTRDNDGQQHYVYPGYRLKTDEELEKESQTMLT